MGFKFKNIAQRARPPVEVQVESLLGFPHGLRTSVPDSMIASSELAECKNFQINRGGQLQSRPGMKKLNTTSLGKIVSLAAVNFGSGPVQLAQSVDNVIHEIKADGSSVPLGSVEGPADIVSYDGHAMLLDGSYLKYLDDTKIVKLAWDGGKAGFFDNRSQETTGHVNYTVAQTTKVPFTTPSWPSGFTIPPTKLEVKIGRKGTGGVGAITLSIYKTADDSLIASGPVELTAPNIAPDPGDFYIANMSNVVSEFEPSTAYYVSLSMTAYNTTNYIVWYTGATSVPTCGVFPSVPPKARHGFILNRRLWLYGNPDAPSYLYFNNYALFDWSTSGQAGFLPAVDNDKDSFPIGAAIAYYGTLFIYGTKEQPFLLQLVGEGAADFAFKDLKQPLWTTAHQITDVINDVWSLSKAGVSSLTGVNMYGDVRTYSESFAIDDVIEYLWSQDSFAGYFIDRGQLWIQVGDRTLVAHTKAPSQGLNRVRYPWSEYTFSFTPSCFGLWGDLVVGSEEGFVYGPDKELTKDDSVNFDLGFKIKYFISPFQKLDILEAKVLIDSRTGAGFELRAYKDDSSTEFVYDWLMSASIHDDVTIDDLGDLKVEEMDFTIDASANPLVTKLGFVCFSYQLEVRAVNLVGSPAYLNGLVVRYRPMED